MSDSYFCSDAFSQKFGREPILVNGFDNLYCMEVDSSGGINLGLEDSVTSQLGNDPTGDLGLASFMQEILSSIPGIDEAMAFAELVKMVPLCYL